MPKSFKVHVFPHCCCCCREFSLKRSCSCECSDDFTAESFCKELLHGYKSLGRFIMTDCLYFNIGSINHICIDIFIKEFSNNFNRTLNLPYPFNPIHSLSSLNSIQ